MRWMAGIAAAAVAAGSLLQGCAGGGGGNFRLVMDTSGALGKGNVWVWFDANIGRS